MTVPNKLKLKKNSLFPLEYDEISLVDSGAAGDADVLIMKRHSVEKATKKRRGPVVDSSFTVVDRKKKRKAASDPCGDTTNSTGAKETDPSKKSKRGKNFKEERHKRDEKGRMKETSAESKKKYGKGGTTKAKQDAECRTVKKHSMTTWQTDALLLGKTERKAT